MNPLKPSDYIYFKIPKYLKEQFLPLYERLLYDTTEQFLNTTYTSNKDSNVHLHSSTYFKININDLSSAWNTFAQLAIHNDSYYSSRNKTYTKLSVCYLKHYIIKKVLPKVIVTSNHLQRSWEFVVRIHIKICKFDIQRMKLNKGVYVKEKRELLPDFEEEGESANKKSVVHLFIGNFNLKKFFDNEQNIKLKETEFCKTFIFSDHDSTKKKKKKVFHTIHNNHHHKHHKHKEYEGENDKSNKAKMVIKLKKKDEALLLNDNNIDNTNSDNNCKSRNNNTICNNYNNTVDTNNNNTNRSKNGVLLNNYHANVNKHHKHSHSNSQHYKQRNIYLTHNNTLNNNKTIETTQTEYGHQYMLTTKPQLTKRNDLHITLPSIYTNYNQSKNKKQTLLKTDIYKKDYLTKLDLYY